MRGIAAVSVLSVCALGATGVAQSNRPDFSGRWRLVQPTSSQLAQETLTVVAADELLIRQTSRELVIEHPSKPGTHPEAGVFEYGAGGRVGGLPGRGNSIDDARGARSTVARGSMWRFESPNRLVIEFGEERAGERPAIATRTYMKVTPQ